MRKLLQIGVKILVIVFTFSFLISPFRITEAKTQHLASSSSVLVKPQTVEDWTVSPTHSLTVLEREWLYEKDTKLYSTQGNWKDETTYLKASFQVKLPEGVSLDRIQAVELEHFFQKNSANTLNLEKISYQIDLGEDGKVDFSRLDQDISAEPVGTLIEDRFDFRSEVQSLTDLAKIGVKIFVAPEAEDNSASLDSVGELAVQKEEPVAKTDHDLLVIEIRYNQPPAVELLQPQNQTWLNSETQFEQGYPAEKPVFKWRVEDPENDPVVSRWQLVKKRGDQGCDFSAPDDDQELDVGVTEFQPDKPLEEGIYCWRVGVSDGQTEEFVWSEIFEFGVDITLPPALVELNIDPQPSARFTNVNQPHIWGRFAASDQDSVGTAVIFMNVGLEDAYVYLLPRQDDSFDSNDPQAELWYVKGVKDLKTLSEDMIHKVDNGALERVQLLKDGVYQVVGFSLDRAGNYSKEEEWIWFDELYRLDTIAPQAPVVSVQRQDSRVIVSWNKVEDGAYYEVYRDGKLVAYTNSLMFIEENLPQGYTYTYWVVAIDQAGNRSQPSQKQSVYIPKPRVSSITYQPAAVSYVPSRIVPEAQAKTKTEPQPAEKEQEGQVKAEEVPEGINWALVVAIILGIILVIGGGLYWWYSREEDEI